MTREAELQRALEESERRYREVFETNTAVKLVIDPESGAIVDANPAACRFYGHPREHLLELRIQDINTMPAERVQEEMARARDEHRLYFRFQHRLADGRVRDVDVYTGPVTVGGRTLLHSIIIDQTERRELERRLLAAQRMDVIGKLAGGIAHDFNNLLAVILGAAELGQRQTPKGHPTADRFDEIVSVAERAADVTRQLLTLARQQFGQVRPVRVRDIVVRIDRLLRRLLGEDVELATLLGDDPWAVLIDPAQLEQVLVNLAVNARDAMPEGGILRIATASKTLGPEEASAAGVTPGRRIECTVEDTGVGMPAEIRERIFEPLFTTKEHQGGTGLGLATCRTIVEGAGGKIAVQSEPGVGTTFTILLPATGTNAAALVTEEVKVAPPRGTETVLVVEDEPRLRSLLVEALKGFGYQVLSASDGASALSLEASHVGPLDLLMADVVMPLMSGIELAERLRARRPALPVLFASGYSAGLVPASALDARTRLLLKPFTTEQLARAVRDLLDGISESAEPGG